MGDLAHLVEALEGGDWELKALPDGSAILMNLHARNIISLNTTAAFLVEALRGGVNDSDELAARLAQHFEVDQQQAREDVATFLATLASHLR